jgi:hypothetical protein
MSESSQIPYQIRYFFEWGGGCLWAGNDAANRDFGYGPFDVAKPCPLPLSDQTIASCRQLSEWHDRSLNWDYPPDPGPWRQIECDRFNVAATRLLTAIRAELGSRFKVLDEQKWLVEDPDLDSYLADRKGFRRGRTS